MLKDRTRHRSNSYLEAVRAPPPPGTPLGNPGGVSYDTVSVGSSAAPSVSSRSVLTLPTLSATAASAALWDGVSPAVSVSPSIHITERGSIEDLLGASTALSAAAVAGSAAAASDDGGATLTPSRALPATAAAAAAAIDLKEDADADADADAAVATAAAAAEEGEEEGAREYPYHPLNKMAFDKGYIGNLTDAQASALTTMKNRVIADNISLAPWLCAPAETEEHFLLRFLRARQFNVNKAWDMMLADITWRTEYGTLALREKTMAEVVQCDVALIHHHLPIWQAGCDLQGRPVVYKR